MTILALVLAIALAALAALVLGYFMIWGGIGGVFVGIVTLSATLVLAFFFGQTAGPEWHIGPARLNGFNGMKDMEPLNIPWFGDSNFTFEGTSLYYLVLVLLLGAYLGLRALVNSRFGNVVVAIREDPQRAELLGYDTRKYQLVVFVVGSALAGLSGVLYTSWGQFITPSSIGLPAAAMVWVAFSGRGDITATLVGSFLILLVFQTLTVYSQQAALVLMGAMLLLTVLLAPQGFVIGLWRLGHRLWRRGSGGEPPGGPARHAGGAQEAGA
jgi:branched-chain amino acid transport system permease protein